LTDEAGLPPTPAVVKLRLRDCSEHPRQLRTSRAHAGLYELDRRLHSVWSQLPLRQLRIAGTFVLLCTAAYVLIAKHAALRAALAEVEHARTDYLLLAILSEIGSIACYVGIFQLLLSRSAVAVPARTIVSLTLIGIAMLNSLPGGQAVSTVYWYQQLTRRHVGRSTVAAALLASTLIGIATLPLLAAGGLALGGRGYGEGLKAPVLVIAGTTLAGSFIFRRHLLPGALRVLRRLGVESSDAPTGAKHLLALLVLGTLNWLLDAGALFAALAALGISLPIPDVLVAYSLGQLVSAIPVLPGGGGSVEATIVAGLVVGGGRTTPIVAAVLLYRIIGAWGFVPIGWFLWLVAPHTRVRAAESPA
jgi:uncharacterized membrane protein YbhN (UPF0104 family)